MRSIVACVMIFCSVALMAQEQEPLKFNTDVNTVGTPTIVIVIDFSSAVRIDNAQFGTNLEFDIYSQKEKIFVSSSIVKSFIVNRTLQLTIQGATKTEIEKFVSLSGSAYLSIENGLNVPFTDGTSLSFSASDVERQSKGKIGLGTETRDMYFKAFGGEYAYANNSFGWGITPKSESDIDKLELNAEFSFQQMYGFRKGKAGEQKPLVFYSKGRVSTNSKDSLNFLYIYPLNFDISGASEAQMMARLGVEGNQTFTSGRMAFNFSYEKLINNLVDFTYGNNRLRLKPIINLGGKIYKEFDNMRIGPDSENELSGQVYANLYYNIPVMNNYSIILESNAYYDFSEKINPDQKIRLNYSIALGIDLPKTPFKTLFKYKDGQVDVNNLADSNLTIGLLADLESLVGSSANR